MLILKRSFFFFCLLSTSIHSLARALVRRRISESKKKKEKDEEKTSQIFLSLGRFGELARERKPDRHAQNQKSTREHKKRFSEKNKELLMSMYVTKREGEREIIKSYFGVLA